jgi:hypothetical protein
MPTSPTDFFAQATNNRLALVPASSALAQYGNTDQGTAQAALDSRVRASSVNGAGPNADPSSAPWGTLTNFALGKSGARLETASVVKKKNRFGR